MLDDPARMTLIYTQAASYVASFVLGIRDRHQDNMLVKDNVFFLHVDFGWMWNKGPPIDSNLMPIDGRLVEL